MTSGRTLGFVALVLAAAIGCDTGSRSSGVGNGTNDVLFRIINTTDVALDLTSSGQVLGGNGHVAAGTTSACIRIDPATTTTLGLREAGAVSDVGSFAPTLTPQTSYTVIAFVSDAGSIATFTLPDVFISTSASAGLRVVDVAPGLGSLDVYVTPRSGPLNVPSATSLTFGSYTGFFDVTSGSSQVRFTTAATSTVVFDAGSITLLPDQLSTLVLSQPGGAAATPVATLVPAC